MKKTSAVKTTTKTQAKKLVTSPVPCIIGFGSSPSRCGPLAGTATNGQTRDLPVPMQGAYEHARLRPREADTVLAISHRVVLPSATLTASAPRTLKLSRLNGWPVRIPVNASQRTSRYATYDSGIA